MSEGPSDKGIRLQVALAKFGVASRRGVVDLIAAGKVTVNGQVVREKGFRVDPDRDKILVEGAEMPSAGAIRKRTFILNKPKGVMTTMQDPNAEKTVADFFKDVPERLFPVGRLDRDTTGLLVMTNDGELAFRLMHPSFGVAKCYRVVVSARAADDRLRALEKGVDLEEGTTAPCRITVVRREAKTTELQVTLHEGKKRQIRRMFQKVGYYVTELERFSYGPLALGEMRYGEKRELKGRELTALRRAAGLKPEKGS